VKVNDYASGKWLKHPQRLRILDLSAAGLTRHEIARECGCSETSVSRVVAAAGGRPSRRSRRRSRSAKQLSLIEREEIRVGLVRGESMRKIARRISRSASTISREIKRNGGPAGYKATVADDRASRLMERAKPSKLVSYPKLRRKVRQWLRDDLSPEQISGRLKRLYPNDPEMRIAPETIYQSLYVQSRGRFRTDLTKHLRTGRSQRKPHPDSPSTRGRIAGMINISERPAEVEDRAVPGHWEGDLIVGKANGSFIGTLVERKTRFVMLTYLGADSRSQTVCGAVAEKIVDLPEMLRKSLTWDQGSEMSKHAAFSVATDVEVFFCDPHSPWQRGSNENTNGLLRQYFPKGSDLAVHGQVELDLVAAKLNRRPRATLDFMTPAEKMSEVLR